jgi:hypothetical protein
VQDSIDAGRVREDERNASRNRLQARTCSTRRSAAPAATRSAPGPRSGSSRSATTRGNGSRERRGPSRGRSTTDGSAAASSSACFRWAAGPSSTSGTTSASSSSCRRSTSPTSGT